MWMKVKALVVYMVYELIFVMPIGEIKSKGVITFPVSRMQWLHLKLFSMFLSYVCRPAVGGISV